MNYSIYTDGACSNNGTESAVGGAAFVILREDGSVFYQEYWKIPNATNNICEMLALSYACYVISDVLSLDDTVTLYTDSAYIINCNTEKWYKKWQENGWRNSKKEPVANRELWERVIPHFEDSRFTFQKVKGHANCEWNNYVDKLAVRAKEEN